MHVGHLVCHFIRPRKYEFFRSPAKSYFPHVFVLILPERGQLYQNSAVAYGANQIVLAGQKDLKEVLRSWTVLVWTSLASRAIIHKSYSNGSQ